jgi:hypothetical protein
LSEEENVPGITEQEKCSGLGFRQVPFKKYATWFLLPAAGISNQRYTCRPLYSYFL